MSRIVFGNIEKDLKAILFDKDGTLIDIKIWKEVALRRLDYLSKYFLVPKKYLYEALCFDENGFNLKKFITETRLDTIAKVKYALRFLGTEVKEKQISEIFDEVDLSLQDRLVKLIDGSKELIENLRKNNVLVIVVTNDGFDRAKWVLEQVDLEVDKIVGCDTYPFRKPDKRLLKAIADDLKLSYDEMAMVGDSLTDIEFGAGDVFTVAVKTGIGDEEAFKKADVVLDSVAQIKLKDGN